MTDAPVSSYLKRRTRSREEVMLLSALKRVMLETVEAHVPLGAAEQAWKAIEEAEKSL